MSRLVEPYKVPFTILVDSAESNPWTFHGFTGDSDVDYRPLAVTTQTACLGRFPHSFGDYSILGHVGKIAVERKSVDDIYSTVLGWKTEYESERDLVGHRERFEHELRNLSKIRYAVIVIEGPKPEVLARAPSWGIKSAEQNSLILRRSVMSYQQRFPNVQWEWAANRRDAEKYTLEYLRRYWRKFTEFQRAIRRADI